MKKDLKYQLERVFSLELTLFFALFFDFYLTLVRMHICADLSSNQGNTYVQVRLKCNLLANN